MHLHGSVFIGIVIGFLLCIPGAFAAEPLWVAHATGTEIPSGIAVSANAGYVAVGGERIAIYAREGEKIWGGFQANELVFSPQGEYLIAATDGGVRYLLPTGRSLWNDDERGSCTDIAVSRDGDYVAAATTKGTVLYSSAGEVLGNNATIQSVSVGVSRDGMLVATGWQDRISLTNRSMEPLWEYTTYGTVSEIFFSSSPPLILASADNALLALHPSGALLWQFLARDSVTDFSASVDAEYIAVGSRDGSVYLLDNNGRKIWEAPTGDWVTHVDISRNGSFIAAGGNARRVLLYATNGAIIMDQPVEGWVRGIGLSPEGGYLGATVDNGATYLYSTALPATPPPSPTETGAEPTDGRTSEPTIPPTREETTPVTGTVTAPMTATPVPATTPRAGSWTSVLVPAGGAAVLALARRKS